MSKRKDADRPVEKLTVTVKDAAGRPTTEIRVGDRTSADIVAATYRRRGAEVTITPTQD